MDNSRRLGDSQKLDVLLAEYNTLRSESLASIDNKLKIVTFGFAGLSVFVGSAVTGDLSEPTFLLITVGVVPILAKGLALIWLGEHRRMLRAGGGVQSVEERINELANEVLLNWEIWLRSGKMHMSGPYWATLGLFQLASTASAVVGWLQWFDGGQGRGELLGYPFVSAAFLVAIVAFEVWSAWYIWDRWNAATIAALKAQAREMGLGGGHRAVTD